MAACYRLNIYALAIQQFLTQIRQYISKIRQTQSNFLKPLLFQSMVKTSRKSGVPRTLHRDGTSTFDVHRAGFPIRTHSSFTGRLVRFLVFASFNSEALLACCVRLFEEKITFLRLKYRIFGNFTALRSAWLILPRQLLDCSTKIYDIDTIYKTLRLCDYQK